MKSKKKQGTTKSQLDAAKAVLRRHSLWWDMDGGGTDWCCIVAKGNIELCEGRGPSRNRAFRNAFEAAEALHFRVENLRLDRTGSRATAESALVYALTPKGRRYWYDNTLTERGHLLARARTEGLTAGEFAAQIQAWIERPKR